MRGALRTLTACSALALALAACGSSGKSSPPTATASSTATTVSTGSSGGSGSANGASGGLRVATTPKFAAPEASAPVRSGLVQVAYRDIAIDPDTLRVRVGSTIRWTNYDDVGHNVTSIGAGPQSFASGEFGEGGTFEIKLVKPGIIHYESTTQPETMNGTIEVLG